MIVARLKEISHILECPWEIFPSCGIRDNRWLVKDMLSLAGLLIFRTVAELRNSGKSMKSLKIHQKAHNTAQFVRNNVKYMSVQHIWNLFQLLGLFSCLETLSLKHANNIPETTRHRLYCEKLALAMLLQALPFVHFWSILLLKSKWWPLLEKC